MNIPEELKPDVVFAITETGCLGTLGAFSTAADVASIAGIWGYLLVKFSRYYGYSLGDADAKKIGLALVTGLGGYVMGCKTATKLFHLIPAAGTLLAMGISSLENVIFTYRFAMTLTCVFEEGDVDFNTITDAVKTMFAGTVKGLVSLKDIGLLMKEHYIGRKA